MGDDNAVLENVVEVLSNSSASEVLPPEVVASLGNLLLILKAVGIAFLIYFIYMIISGVLSWRRNRKISRMYKKINEIDEKLDKLLEQSHKKNRESKEKKKEKKK